MKRIVIGSDHAGFKLKSALVETLRAEGRDAVDAGVHSEASANYTPVAKDVAGRVAAGADDIGILICGSGIGMSMAANRVAGVRAALCEDEERARLARQHNDANILVLAGRFLTEEKAKGILKIFLDTTFEGGRHVERVRSIDGDCQGETK